MSVRSHVRQFLVAFAATALSLVLLVKLDVLTYVAYSIEKGRLRAIREQLPTVDELAARSMTSRQVAELVSPAVVSIVSAPPPIDPPHRGRRLDDALEDLGRSKGTETTPSPSPPTTDRPPSPTETDRSPADVETDRGHKDRPDAGQAGQDEPADSAADMPGDPGDESDGLDGPDGTVLPEVRERLNPPRPTDAPGPDERGPPATRPVVPHGVGSGFVFDADRGLIVTNAHVVGRSSTLVVYLPDGRRCEATVLGVDPADDLAVIEIPVRPLHAIGFADSDAIGVGDEVFAVGSPFGLVGTFSKGIISATRQRRVAIEQASYDGLIQTDAVINPGNSGGPLVNMRGEVVGISTAIATRDGVYSGVGFAIPANRVRARLEELASGGPAFLGVRPVDAATIAAERSELGWDGNGGAVITDVVPNSAADRAGVRVDDIIEALDDLPIADAGALVRALRLRKPGDTISLHIWRDGAFQTVPVTLRGRYEPG